MKKDNFFTERIHSGESLGFCNIIKKPEDTKKVFFRIALLSVISIVFLITNSISTLAQNPEIQGSEIVDIGSQRQLFVDNFLEEKFTGGAELRLHHPVIQEIALLCDKPWEGSFSNYNSIFKDGDIYRMYYRG